MKRIYVTDTEQLYRGQMPGSACGTVCALGFFDGMHKAHRALISQARERADELDIPLTVFTFSSSGGGFKPSARRILTDEERLHELESLCVDVAVICDFGAVRDLGAEEFVRDVLLGYMNTRVAVSGYNFRFGKGAAGNTELLCSLLPRAGAEAVVLPRYEEDGVTLSSTLIRELIASGDVRRAARFMGIPLCFNGTVSHGLGLGTGMGIPTVNTELDAEKLAPPRGVYFTAVKIDGVIWPALTNVGTCPTMGERAEHAETYILDFCGDLYGCEIRIFFIDRIRDERTFTSGEELVMQIKKDEERVRALAKETVWQEIGLS